MMIKSITAPMLAKIKDVLVGVARFDCAATGVTVEVGTGVDVEVLAIGDADGSTTVSSGARLFILNRIAAMS